MLDYHNQAVDAARKEYYQAFKSVTLQSRPSSADLPLEDSSDSNDDTPSDPAEGQNSFFLFGQRILLGDLGIALGLIGAIVITLVGLVYVPAVSMDVSSIMELISLSQERPTIRPFQSLEVMLSSARYSCALG